MARIVKPSRKERRMITQRVRDLADQIWSGKITDLTWSWERESPYPEGWVKHTISWREWYEKERDET